MSLAELARRFSRLLAMVVLGSSGYFVIVYLLRWEWNRALIAGVFLLAAEIFLVADLILSRLTGLTRQVELARETEEINALAAQLRRNRPPSKGPFAWLSPPQDRTYVFVPILLGAGIILSVIAFLVERLSRVTAAPVAEHELARGLAAMALPRTGLAPTGELPQRRWDAPVEAGRASKRTTWIIAAGIAVLTAVIVVLRLVLITRPAPADPNAALAVELVVLRNNLDQSEVSIAGSLWGICRVRIPADATLQSLEASDPVDTSRFRMVVSPAPAEFDIREFLGCLQDTTIDRARADVITANTLPWVAAAT